MVTVDITMVIQMINMVVLMFLLNGVLYKPVKKILKERSEKMQGMQNDVAKFEENARLRQEEVDAKMSKASGKAKAALDAARVEAQAAGDEKMASIKLSLSHAADRVEECVKLTPNEINERALAGEPISECGRERHRKQR